MLQSGIVLTAVSAIIGTSFFLLSTTYQRIALIRKLSFIYSTLKYIYVGSHYLVFYSNHLPLANRMCIFL